MWGADCPSGTSATPSPLALGALPLKREWEGLARFFLDPVAE